MPEITDDQWSEIEAHLYAGRKIEAIKAYREATGAGLKEAKEMVDEHEATLREQFPQRFTSKGKQGCGAAVLMLFIAVIGGVTAAMLFR